MATIMMAFATSMEKLTANARSSTLAATAMTVIATMDVNKERAFTPQVLAQHSMDSGKMANLLSTRCSATQLTLKVTKSSSHLCLRSAIANTRETGVMVHLMVMDNYASRTAFSSRAYLLKDGVKAKAQLPFKMATR